MDSYNDTINWLFTQLPMFQSLGAGAYKPGLDTARTVASSVGHPHCKFKPIHIGGTNGKGSTSHSLAAVLMKAGYKVGLYTSPHLFDFRERIRVNGEKITKEAVMDFVMRYRAKELGCEPSFFELATIMAFEYFAKEAVDVAVIEVGLGGKLDTTNIISPILSIITNVSLDHVALLGDTEVAIAGEKAGIIKPHTPVVVGESYGEVREVFAQKANKENSPIRYADDIPLSYRIDANCIVYDAFVCGEALQITSDLIGDCQHKNMATIVAAINALHGVLDIPIHAISEGLADVQGLTGLMGRWMTLRASSPTIVCDTGHNIGAWQYLAPTLQSIADQRPLRLVLGFANDKDVDAIFALLPKNAEYYFVTPQVKRAKPATELLQLGEGNGLKGVAFDAVAAGCEKALADSSDEDFIFIGGSNFVVAEIPATIARL